MEHKNEENHRPIFKLTGRPVSDEMISVLDDLEKGKYVDLDRIENTPEVQLARKHVNYSIETINISGREKEQTRILRDILSMGTANSKEREDILKGNPPDKDWGTMKPDAPTDMEFIKASYNQDIAHESRLDIVVGLPASGKSSAIVDAISDECHARIRDNDDVKRLIPEFNEGWGAGVVHEESAMINDAAFKMAIKNHDNIVLPKVGSNADKLIKGYIAQAKEEGYKVNVHFVDLDRNKALGRMLKRFIDRGRFLDPGLIDGYSNERDGNKIEKAFESLKTSDLVDGYSKWDNDVSVGERPILLESQGLSDDFIKDARINDRIKINESEVSQDGRVRESNNGSEQRDSESGSTRVSGTTELRDDGKVGRRSSENGRGENPGERLSGGNVQEDKAILPVKKASFKEQLSDAKDEAKKVNAKAQGQKTKSKKKDKSL